MFFIPTPPALVALAPQNHNGVIVPQTLAISKQIAMAHPRHLPLLTNAERKLFTAAIIEVNRKIESLLSSNLPDEDKKLKLVDLQKEPLQKLIKIRKIPDLQKLLKKIDKLTKNEVLEHVKHYPLSVGDDPFGKKKSLGIGDDPFDFIGETEKNLLKTDPLGGNVTLMELAQGTFSPDIRPKR